MVHEMPRIEPIGESASVAVWTGRADLSRSCGALAISNRVTSATKAILVPLAYIAFVLGAGALVYSFVSVVREGETRRRCSAECLLRPDYAAANRKTPSSR